MDAHQHLHWGHVHVSQGRAGPDLEVHRAEDGVEGRHEVLLAELLGGRLRRRSGLRLDCEPSTSTGGMGWAPGFSRDTGVLCSPTTAVCSMWLTTRRGDVLLSQHGGSSTLSLGPYKAQLRLMTRTRAPKDGRRTTDPMQASTPLRPQQGHPGAGATQALAPHATPLPASRPGAGDGC